MTPFIEPRQCKQGPLIHKRKQTIIWHDEAIIWKQFPRYWPFVREIHRSPVNFPHKGQWHGALMFSLICARINGRLWLWFVGCCGARQRGTMYENYLSRVSISNYRPCSCRYIRFLKRCAMNDNNWQQSWASGADDDFSDLNDHMGL